MRPPLKRARARIFFFTKISQHADSKCREAAPTSMWLLTCVSETFPTIRSDPSQLPPFAGQHEKKKVVKRSALSRIEVCAASGMVQRHVPYHGHMAQREIVLHLLSPSALRELDRLRRACRAAGAEDRSDFSRWRKPGSRPQKVSTGRSSFQRRSRSAKLREPIWRCLPQFRRLSLRHRTSLRSSIARRRCA